MESSPVHDQDKVAGASPRWKIVLRNTAFVVIALLVFILALDLMLATLQYLGKPVSETIILATSNPFTALFIGLLVTAIIQSSTATTSMTVALVASGSLTLESAVPIIMGANVGTTITSTMVSLGFLSKKKEFRRAVAAGTYHDFFNILTVIVLFPLEYYFQFLSRLAQWAATTFFEEAGTTVSTNFSLLPRFGAVTQELVDLIGNGFILVLLSLTIFYGSILVFRRVLTKVMGFGSPEKFQRFFFHRPITSFTWGVLTTAAIRSSSVTTSLVVPLVAKKLVRLRSAVPFILGANIGTTISAFLASLVNSNAAISIAIAHFLFNFIGVLIFYPIPALRELPIRLARGLGQLTLRYRLAGLLYLLLTFFFIPFTLIYFNRNAVSITELTYQRFEEGRNDSFTVITRTQSNHEIGSWTIHEGTGTKPQGIYSVYRKRNLLFINNELYELNRPGFCRDGEDQAGKFRMCLREIRPQYVVSPTLTLDSIFVFEKNYEPPGSTSTWSYVCSSANLLVRKEKKDTSGQVLQWEQLSGLTKK